MIEWNKYIDFRSFISTHGIKLPYKWEFDRLELNEEDKKLILASIISMCYPTPLVIIYSVHPKSLEQFADFMYYPSSNVLEDLVYKRTRRSAIQKIEDYIIYDDVITTGKTVINCIEKIGQFPSKIICLIDRREEALKSIDDNGWSLDVISLQKVLNILKIN